MVAGWSSTCSWTIGKEDRRPRRLVYRREYHIFYAISALFGIRKQIFLVFGTWVLVSLHQVPVSTIALLMFLASGLGVLLRPLLGDVIDWLGERTVLAADEILLLTVCLVYAFASNLFPCCRPLGPVGALRRLRAGPSSCSPCAWPGPPTSRRSPSTRPTSRRPCALGITIDSGGHDLACPSPPPPSPSPVLSISLRLPPPSPPPPFFLPGRMIRWGTPGRWTVLPGALASFGRPPGGWRRPAAGGAGFIVLVNLYYLWKMSRGRDYFSLMTIRRLDNRYLQTFLEFHARDIARFFPDFALEEREDLEVTFILRNVNPAGLVISRREDAEVRILLDYVLPQYRDLRCARFFLEKMAPVWRRQGIRRLLSPAAGATHRESDLDSSAWGVNRVRRTEGPLFERSLD